jgi:hypothetical protein
MRSKAPFGVLVLILALAVVSGVLVVVDSRDRDAQAARAKEFQELIGGMGFGPAVDLGRCPYGFDPRLSHRCTADLGPIPGGGCFCPHHACSVLYYPALDKAP